MESNGQTMFLPDKPQPAAAAYHRGDPAHAPRTRFVLLPNHAPVGRKPRRRTNSHLCKVGQQVQTVQNMMIMELKQTLAAQPSPQRSTWIIVRPRAIIIPVGRPPVGRHRQLRPNPKHGWNLADTCNTTISPSQVSTAAGASRSPLASWEPTTAASTPSNRLAS